MAGHRARAVALGGPSSARTSPTSCRSPRRRAHGGAEAVTLVNTVLGMAIDPETGAYRLGSGSRGGGLSGPAIHPIAVRAVHDVHAALPDLPIVGVGGVATGADAAELILAGASAVQVGTATFADPRAPARVLRELEAWLSRRTHPIHPCQRGRPPTDREIRRSHDHCPPRLRRRCASRLAVALDLDDSVAALRLARELQPVVRRGQGRPRALQRVGTRRGRRAARPRLPGVLRPEVPRHPHHRRTGRPGGGRARRHLPELPRAGRRAPCSRRGRRRLPRRRGQRGPAGAGAARRHRSSRATTKRPRTSCRSACRPRSRRAAGASCARRRTCTRRSSTARASPRWCPASGRPARPRTIRPGRPPRRRRWTPGPTCSSSAGAVTHADDPAAAAAAVAESITMRDASPERGLGSRACRSLLP